MLFLGKKKSLLGCINILVVSAGYSGKKWSL